jgi:hypothetical protein
MIRKKIQIFSVCFLVPSVGKREARCYLKPDKDGVGSCIFYSHFVQIISKAVREEVSVAKAR